jgi:hypothetical protein
MQGESLIPVKKNLLSYRDGGVGVPAALAALCGGGRCSIARNDWVGTAR